MTTREYHLHMASFKLELANKADRSGEWTPDMRHADKAEYRHDLGHYVASLRMQAERHRRLADDAE